VQENRLWRFINGNVAVTTMASAVEYSSGFFHAAEVVSLTCSTFCWHSVPPFVLVQVRQQECWDAQATCELHAGVAIDPTGACSELVCLMHDEPAMCSCPILQM
jgi:hypothetical protein